MKYVQPTTESIQLTAINGLYVEKIKGRLRPFVPKKMRKIIFDQLHGMAHGGIKATRNLICTRFVWPNVKRDVAKWTKACINCQKAKVTVHNRADMSSFEENISEKWKTWHIDIVGKLEDCDGYQYILTMIDRYSSWVEMIPLKRVDAHTVTSAFYLHLVARYGIPKNIISDRGSVFLSGTFTRFLESIGCTLHTSTSYSPQFNGKIERVHRSLKSRLRIGESHRWIESMAAFLMMYRINYREELGCCPSELVFGEPLRIPADLLDETEIPQFDRYDYADRIRKSMSKIVPKYRKYNVSGKMQCKK